MSVVTSKTIVALDGGINATIFTFSSLGIILEITTESPTLEVDVRLTPTSADQLADALHDAATKAAGR